MTNNKKIEINYTLADGEIIQVQVTEAVAEVLKNAEKEQEAQEKKDRRNRDRYINPEKVIKRLTECSPENEIIRRLDQKIIAKEIHTAMQYLTESQARRVYAYYFEGLNYCEIAQKERVRKQVIQRSVCAGLTNLKKFFKTGVKNTV